MAKGFTRKGRLKNALSDLRLNLGTAPVIFADDVIEEFGTFAQRAVPTPPNYRRIMLRKGSQLLFSHHSEMLLILEGCAFFVHLVDRLAYRRSSELLRDACDPPVNDSIQLVANVIETIHDDAGDPDAPVSRDNILRFIDARAEEYANAKSILGADLDDKGGLVGLASATIAETVGPPGIEALKESVSIALLRSIERVGWPNLVKDIEANL